MAISGSVEEDEEEPQPIGGSSNRHNSKKIKLIGEEENKLKSSEEVEILQSEEEMAIASNLEDYNMMELIGEGTFGKVYKAEDKRTNEIVALKKLKPDAYVHESEIPEIKILKKLRHPNIIGLKEVIDDKNEGVIYIVLEYMDYDLAGLAKGEPISAPVIKDYMKQLLSGLAYCHANKVLHRDIKCANILISKKGILKIADFGQSRSLDESNAHEDGDAKTYRRDYSLQDIFDQLTTPIITLAYRPPEILLGSSQYGSEVDIWSAGCVFAQLLNGGLQILPGINEDDQLKRIYQICGTPDEVNWPTVSELYHFDYVKNKFPVRMERCLKEKYKHFDGHALELLDRMLILDPSKRISAADALTEAYFLTDA